MAIRNAFAPQQPVDDYVDPALYMSTPLPAAPAAPMDGGNNGTGTSQPGGSSFFEPQPSDILQPQAAASPIVSDLPPPVTRTPGYQMPTPGPNASAPRPNVNPDVVYTDASGMGYDPPALAAKWADPSFRNDPVNARVGDILAQYEYGGAATSKKSAGDGSDGGGGGLPGGSYSPSVGFSLPETQLGEDVSGGLRDLIGRHGMTPEQQSLLERVNKIIAGGGALPSDTDLEQQQLESARENESQAFGAQLGDARDELASRGLVSEPGVPQGSEAEAIANITRTTAPAYAQAVRDIKSKQIETQNNRLTSAIASATGLTGDAARNLVATLGEGTQRQVQLAGIALDSLSQNMQWQEFLANYGLNRDQVLASIQNGNIGSLMTLISLFEQTTGLAAGGHI